MITVEQVNNARGELIKPAIDIKYIDPDLNDNYKANVILADTYGFCNGARRALRMAEELPEAYILGDVVHNKQVMEKLALRDKVVISGVSDKGHIIPNIETVKWFAKKGIRLNKYTVIVDKPVVITGHGIKKDVIENLNRLKLDVDDSTCKMVKNIYRAGIELEKEGYNVLIIGDKDHVEVKGIASRLTNPIIIKTITEARLLDLPEKLGIICQSTCIESEFDSIAGFLAEKITNIKIKKTICTPTLKRQKAAIDLAKKSDVVIVIGGKHSSNTVKLKELTCKYTETYHIQVPEELEKYWFYKKEIIGITAGASTPDWIIDDVKEAVERIVC